MENVDVEAYFTGGLLPTREGWSKNTWADLNEPFLTGPSQQAYLDLPPEVYANLKKETFARHGYCLQARAQTFYYWKYSWSTNV